MQFLSAFGYVWGTLTFLACLLVAVIVRNHVFDLWRKDRESELAGALEGSLEPYVRDLNREAGK